MAGTESGEGNPWPNRAAVAMLLLGVVFVGVSFVWASVSTGRSEWSDEQARAYQAASADLHSLTHKYGEHLSGAKGEAIPPELQQARAKYDELRGQLDTARARPLALALALRVTGMALAVVGAALYFATSSR